MKVQDVMSSPAVSVSTDTPVRRLAEVMSENGYSGLPVVDEHGVVLGVVSEADLVAKADRTARRLGPLRPIADRAGRRPKLRLGASVAGELMTAPALTVRADEDVRLAARRLTQHRVKRLPVLEDGKLVGIITRLDVLRAFLRSDEDILGEIEDKILGRHVLDPSHDVKVGVVDGVVTLRGTCARRSTAELIRHAVDRVDGVIGVVDGLLYAVDDLESAPVSQPLGRLEFHL